MESVDERYSFAKTLILEGKIKTLDDIYKIIPKKVIAKDLKLNPVSFSNNRSNNPGDFKLSEIIRISELMGIDLLKLVSVFKSSIDEQGTKQEKE